MTDNPTIRICVNKIKNRTTFKIKRGYYLKLLTPQTFNTKDENGENLPQLEITGLVIVNCNTLINVYQQDSRVLYTLVLNKLFDQLLDISPKKFIFLKIFN